MEDGSFESSEEMTKEDLENAMITTICEFATFVSAITRDLEEKEEKKLARYKKAGKKPFRRLWEDSTFKIDFTKGLLLNLFEPERLTKYYIVMVLPMKPWLVGRKVNFFLKNDHIFPGAPTEDIQFFKDLWTEKEAMNDDEKNIIWEYFDTLIEIAEDWHELTGWEPSPEEDLIMPDIDYSKAERYANGEDVDLGERVVYGPEGGGSYISNIKKGASIADTGLKKYGE